MKKYYEDPSAIPTAVVSLVFVLLVVVALYGLQAYYGSVRADVFAEKVEGRPSAERVKVLAEQNEVLNTYGWADREAGTVRIPIERAMEIVAAELAADGGAR